jgi:hypothetical protein
MKWDQLRYVYDNGLIGGRVVEMTYGGTEYAAEWDGRSIGYYIDVESAKKAVERAYLKQYSVACSVVEVEKYKPRGWMWWT